MKKLTGWVLYVLVMGLVMLPEVLLEEQTPEVVIGVSAVVGVIWLFAAIARRRLRRELGESTDDIISGLCRPPVGDGCGESACKRSSVQPPEQPV